MTVPVSTVPTAISYLATAIQAQINTDATPGDIELLVGDPAQDAPDVFVEIASNVRRTVSQIAEVHGWQAGSLGEVYDIDITVSVAMQTANVLADTVALTERTWQIVGYVETAVRLDLSLGGAVWKAVPRQTRGGAARWAPNGVARICEVVIPINCSAII